MFLRSTVINPSLRIRNSEFNIKAMLFFLHLSFGLRFAVTVWHKMFLRIGDFFEVCAKPIFAARIDTEKFPLETNFCGFLFKQQNYIQCLSIFGKKIPQSSRTGGENVASWRP